MSNKVRRIETFLKIILILSAIADLVFAIVNYIHHVWLEASSFTVQFFLLLTSLFIATDLLDALYFSTEVAESVSYKEQKALQAPTAKDTKNSGENIATLFLQQRGAPRTNGDAYEDVFNYLLDLTKTGDKKIAVKEIQEAKQLGLLAKDQEEQLRANLLQ